MEEILNKWQLELDQATRDFHKQAVEIMQWDRMLIENGHTVINIFSLFFVYIFYYYCF